MEELEKESLLDDAMKALKTGKPVEKNLVLTIEGEDGEPPRKVLNEDEIGELVKRDIEAAKQYQQRFLKKWSEIYRYYKAIPDQEYLEKGRSQIVTSDIMDTIEWILPSLMRIFTASDDVVVINPVGPEDEEAAKLMQDLINYQFNYKMDGFLKLYTWFKEALIYGTGIIKVSWDRRYNKKNFFFDELTEEEFEALKERSDVSIESFEVYNEFVGSISPLGDEMIEVKKVYKNVTGFYKKLTYEGPVLENIPITAFYIEPGARNISEANFVAHRTIRTMDYLRRMQREGIYHNVEKVVVSEAEPIAPEDLAVFTEDRMPEVSVKSPTSPGREKVEVWECWVKLDVDGDGLLEPLVVTIANDTVIRVEINPFEHGEPPFEALVPIIDVHKFYGISLSELVMEIQKIKTAIIRLLLDNMAFVTNKMYLVSRMGRVNLQSLAKSRPGGIVEVDDINSVRELVTTPLPAYVFNLLDYLDVQKEMRTGVNRFFQGLPANMLSVSKTATGVAAMLSAAQQKVDLIARIFAETGVKKLFMKLISLNQQFIRKEMVVRIFNKELRITPDALDGSFDLLVNVGIGAGLKEVHAQKLIQLLNILPPLAQLGLVTPEHIYNIVKELLLALGFKDISKFITKPEQQQVNPMLQQMQALMAQKGKGGGKEPSPELLGAFVPEATGELPPSAP